MRQLYAIILLGTFTFFGGCGGDDGTRPQDDGGAFYEVHDSATVGAEGGVLEGDDFVATIPAGALDADYDLELRSSGDEQPWGETTASDVYVLDGVPEGLRLAPGVPAAGER